MRPSQLGVVLGALATVHMTAATAAGGLVTFEFEGEITHIFDPDDLLGGAVTVGTPLYGSYTFESTTPDSDPESRGGFYENAVVSISGEVGALSFSGPAGGPMNIWVEDSVSVDTYLVDGNVEFLSHVLDIEIGLVDGSGTALTDDGLPPSPPELALFGHVIFGISDRSEELDLAVTGQLTSLVPEPSTLALLALVLVGLAARRRSHVSAQ